MYYALFGISKNDPAPINPEQFANSVLGLNLKMLPLCSDGHILGLTVFQRCSFTATLEDGTKLVEVFMPRDIVIDSALAADRCTGCRNFTIAHEAAHQILADLFPNDYGKAVKCRGHIAYRERNGKPSWEEWQADTLAAELLMPTFLINAEIERVALTLPNGILYKSVSDPNYEKILEMARRIGVSWSAIRIRLQQMQVIKGKPIHCHLFEVILINDKRRIVISSFEKWYANQVKYHKVNGSPPGEELCKRSYSVPDAAEILKVKPETIYTLIRQGKLKTETADFCMRIPKEDFERWYRSQSRYRTAADRERDREIEAQTISIPEMAKLLGIPRKNVYGILDCKKYRDCFVIERVADRPRITKKSFKAWLKSQSTYQLQKPKKETHEEPPLKLQCPKNGKYYSFQEIQAFYGISRPTLDSWVLKEGIPTMKLGRVKRIQKDAFDEVLKSKRKVEEDV